MSEYIHFKQGNTQLLTDLPHSGVELPESHNLDINAGYVQRTIRFGVDLAAPGVTGFHHQKNSRIYTTASRVFLDLNRGVSDIDKYSVEGSEEEMHPHGLIWRASIETREEDIKDLLTKPYTTAELQGLIKKFHTPYHNAVRDEMFRLRGIHGRAISFALHSFPASLPEKVDTGKYSGAYLFPKPTERGSLKDGKLPDAFIINNEGSPTCDPEISQLVIDIFSANGYLVEIMPVVPIKTTSPRDWVNPEDGLHFLGIELVRNHLGQPLEPRGLEGFTTYNRIGQEKMMATCDKVFRKLESWGR
ncbi:MAG: N-formylglutamate amidohydrolase [Candidatus Woesearchaeota archaeon]